MKQTRKQFIIVLLVALLGVVLTARLGWWQLDRAAQKRELQAAIDTRAALPALQGAELNADQLHRRVSLRGRWLADKTVFLENRPMQGKVGFFVVTPLQLSDRPEALLVQRGWLPRNNQERAQLPSLDTPTGEVLVEGRLSASPSRLYEFAPSAGGVIRQNLDAAAYAKETGLVLLPLTVLQSGPAEEAAEGLAKGLLREWAAPELGLQKHYGYAFQWFALSALLLGLYVWFQLIRPRRLRQAG